MQRWALLGRTSLVAAAAGVVALGVRLEHVHSETWEWGLSPAATPAKPHYLGRDYLRSGPTAAPSGGAHRLRDDSGGGEVWARTLSTYAPAGLTVRSSSGGWVGYSLMGGP
ncbi:hypothetical protein EV189_3922 [Motilibacter rhizosphaerae]|uniref:Uncharacterized protein n=1 Tax=Motilibacter rhizosphaerae TaxID=598652 RepID=A0A4Q7NA40_9ACTN|nr:hypothetical protein [Motilibacter rhizosphaerae]RZS79052.1 hypothetical protein EV189_3922 [Motilibacter rhizosphaerae]